MSGKTIAELRAELEAKRAANTAKESATASAAEHAALLRDIAIEDEREKQYAADVIEEQLITVAFPGVGRCLFRTPEDRVYRSWAKRSGVLKGDLVNDPVVHDELVAHCILVPKYDEFKALAAKRCPHAPVQLAGALIERMKGKVEAEGK